MTARFPTTPRCRVTCFYATLNLHQPDSQPEATTRNLYEELVLSPCIPEDGFENYLSLQNNKKRITIISLSSNSMAINFKFYS